MIAASAPDVRSRERGFTLVEALVAMIILAFGMIAVTNLMIVAASSNSVANQSTAATTAATEAMETLKALPFSDPGLAPGGSLTGNATVGTIDYFRNDTVPGVGIINTRWVVSAVAGDPLVKFIRVRSEGTGALSRARSAAEFTAFRSCSATAAVNGGGCP